MPNPLLTLWIDGQNNTLLTGWEAQSLATLPTLKQGDSVGIEVHIVSTSKGLTFMEEIEFEQNSVVRVAVGRTDQKPSTGYLIFGYEGDTVEVPYSTPITSTQQVPVSVNSLINGMPSIAAAGGVTVSIVNGFTYRIVFNEAGVRSEVTCDSTNLRPTSTALNKRIVVGSLTSKDVQHIKPKVIPVAYQETFTDSPSPEIVISYPSPAITRVSIKPQPKYGSFVISNGTLTTGPISINATSDELLNELTLVGINDTSETPTGSTYSALKVGPFDWDISRTSGPTETLSVSSTGLIGFKSKYGFLNLNNEEVEDLLAGASSVSATLEVEVSNSAGKHTAYQGQITIVNDLIDNQTFSPVELPSLITEAPINGVQYARKDGSWYPVQLDGNNIPDYDNSLVYSVGNQVYYQGKLYRMIAAVGAAGYQPDVYPTYWESLSGSTPDLSNYVEKSGATMGFGAQIAFEDSFSNLVIGAGGVGIYSIADGESVTLYDNKIEVSNQTNTTKVIPTGVTFPDLTTQTTAAVSFDPTGYATESWANSTFSSISHNHDIFGLTNFVQSDMQDGDILKIWSPDYGSGPNPPIVYPRGNFWIDWTQSLPSSTTFYCSWDFYDDNLGMQQAGSHQIVVTLNNVLRYRLNTAGQISFQISPNQSYSYSISNDSGFISNGIEYYGDHITIFIPSDTSIGSINYSDSNIEIIGSSNIVYGNLSYTINDYPAWTYETNNGFTLPEIRANGYDQVVFRRGLMSSIISGVNYDNGLTELNGSGGFALTFDDANNKFSFSKPWIADLQPQFDNYALLAGATFTGKVNTTATAFYAGLRIGVSVSNPSSTVAGDTWIGTNNLIFKDSTNTLRTVPNTSSSNTFSANQIISGSSTSAMLRITQTGTGQAIVVEDATNPDTTAFIVNTNGIVAIGRDPSTWSPATGVFLDVAGKGLFTATTTHPSLNIGTVASNPTTLVNGDVWINTALNYRNSAGTTITTAGLAVAQTFTQPQVITSQTSSTLPVLRLTNLATSSTVNSFVVEDSTNPDTSSFVIDHGGNVGIGVNPATWVATQKFEIQGSIKFSDNSVQATAYIPSAVAITGGTINNITIDGGTF